MQRYFNCDIPLKTVQRFSYYYNLTCTDMSNEKDARVLAKVMYTLHICHYRTQISH